MTLISGWRGHSIGETEIMAPRNPNVPVQLGARWSVELLAAHNRQHRQAVRAVSARFP
jgi:hypothetical protein